MAAAARSRCLSIAFGRLEPHGRAWWMRTGCSCYLDARALVRLQADNVNRSLVPAFYRYLQAQDEGQLTLVMFSTMRDACT